MDLQITSQSETLRGEWGTEREALLRLSFSFFEKCNTKVAG